MTRSSPGTPLLVRIEARRVVDPNTGCWLSTYAANPRTGYCRVGDQYVHRVAYELLVGAIPAGYVIDHLCRVRACFNPDHLEAVTNYENTVVRGVGNEESRREHCPAGHPYDVTRVRANGRPGRDCSTCNRARAQQQAALIRQAHMALGITQAEYRAIHGHAPSTARAILESLGVAPCQTET